MTRFSAIRRWLRRTSVGVAVVFMLVVIVGAGYWVWTILENTRLERKVSVVRSWPPNAIRRALGKDRRDRDKALKASVKTRCSEGVLYYHLSIVKDETSNAKEGLEELALKVSTFTVTLADADDFKV